MDKSNELTLTQAARENITNSQAQYKSRYDTHRQDPSYKIGDLVLIKAVHHKFDVRYEGPFRITQQNAQKHSSQNMLRKPHYIGKSPLM
ncbi:unnamed protein product [Didymodactylos carnosus]|uniref:Uncharacterized protein n=1 Tax=Didymodactylos carnosus TaxID=1234261 RepID=A0A815Z4Y4_9BILA|nr:unnamed protein product [Didymodactylos carnosus]CAF4446537.1 unnamed protein product [Didymodactylos carnosus]